MGKESFRGNVVNFLYYLIEKIETDIEENNRHLQNHTKRCTLKFYKEKTLEDVKYITVLNSVIEKNIDVVTLSIDDLAKQMNTTGHVITIQTLRIYGLTAKGYLTNYRMNRAKAMIIDDKLTLTEIQELVGSSNLQTFNRTFKKQFGISPQKFKIDHQLNKLYNHPNS